MRISGLNVLLWAVFVAMTPILAADDVEYFILPRERLNDADLFSLETVINRLAGGASNVYASKRPKNPRPIYWVTSLPTSGFQELQSNPLVGTNSFVYYPHTLTLSISTQSMRWLNGVCIA